jgi:hypothetical protein
MPLLTFRCLEIPRITLPPGDEHDWDVQLVAPRVFRGKSGQTSQCKRVYREQSANPEALLPASPLSRAEFDPLR